MLRSCLAPENSETSVFAALPVVLGAGWRHTPGDGEGAASGAAAGQSHTRGDLRWCL